MFKYKQRPQSIHSIGILKTLENRTDSFESSRDTKVHSSIYPSYTCNSVGINSVQDFDSTLATFDIRTANWDAIYIKSNFSDCKFKIIYFLEQKHYDVSTDYKTASITCETGSLNDNNNCSLISVFSSSDNALRIWNIHYKIKFNSNCNQLKHRNVI